jgi:hypothetical protein
MTGDESGAIRETSRRMLLRHVLLVSSGAAAVGLTSTSLVGIAQAASASVSPAQPAQPASLTAPDTPAPVQWGWAWCSKCQGMFWASGNSHGVCPAGGSHGHLLSSDYGLRYNAVVISGYQDNWWWCNKCSGLFFGAGELFSYKGACPAGGQHYSNTSSDYVVYLGAGSYSSWQIGWRWCNQCQGMWWANRSAHGGICPFGGGMFSHTDSGSGAYQIQFQ